MDLAPDVWILILRLLLVLVLYAFLYQVAVAVYRGLQPADPATRERTTPRPTRAAPRAEPVATLLVVESGLADVPVGSTFALAGVATVGRTARNDIRLGESFVSAEHARFEVRGAEVTLVDLGSTNGTLLNGEPVSEPTAVGDGDSIQFGSVRMVLRRGA